MAKASLGTRLQEAELGFTQVHISANLVLALLVKIKARQYFAVARRKIIEDAYDQLDPLMEGCVLVWVTADICHANAYVQIQPFASDVDDFVEMGDNLSAYDGAYEPHEAFGFTELAFADGLDDDQKSIVYLIIHLLWPKFAV